MSSALNWFEIPVADLSRAKRFYGTVLQADFREETMNDIHLAIFPYEKGGVGGALAQGQQFVPGGEGAVVYLNAGDDLDGVLSRVEPAGGKVVMGRTRLSDQIGSIAFLEDTEGNRVGLHSPR